MSGLRRGKGQTNRSSVVYDRSAVHVDTIYEDRSKYHKALPQPVQSMPGATGTPTEVKLGEVEVYDTEQQLPFIRSNSQADLLDEEEAAAVSVGEYPNQVTAPAPAGPPQRPPPPQQLQKPPQRPSQQPLNIARKPVGESGVNSVKAATINRRQLNYVPISVFVLAVISTVFFFPLGLLSLIKAFEASKLVSSALLERAFVAGQDAKGLAYLAFAVGLFFYGVFGFWWAGICQKLDKLCI